MIPGISWGDNFAGLTDYLIEHRDHQLVDLRGVSSIDNAPSEMAEVALTSTRVRKPAMHVSFSAAIEDGVLADALWLDLLNEVDREFNLENHQRVVVRHRDKRYDHIHAFWCTVNPQTGQCPPKQMFRKRNAALPELDQRALSVDVVAQLPSDAVARGAFNRFALSRLMTICRAFEAAKGLRRLRDRKGAAAARVAGEARPVRQDARHRQERTGRSVVTAAADVIRNALDRPDYTSMRVGLNQAGFDFEPVMRKRRDGSVEARGLVIIDMIDPGNRAPASAFDTHNRRYGLRQIETRHVPGAAMIEEWWPARNVTGADERPTDVDDIEQAYQQLRERHRDDEARRSEQRRHLAVRQAEERRLLRAKLMWLRRLRAAQLAPKDRRAFYARFARTTRASIWTRMERRHANERATLRRRAMPSWKQFQSERAINARVIVRPAVTAAPQGTFSQSGIRPKSSDPNTREKRIEEEADMSLAEFYRARHEREGR